MHVGLGGRLPLDEHVHLNVGCTLDWTFGQYDIGNGKERQRDALLGPRFIVVP